MSPETESEKKTLDGPSLVRHRAWAFSFSPMPKLHASRGLGMANQLRTSFGLLPLAVYGRFGRHRNVWHLEIFQVGRVKWREVLCT